MAKIAFSKLKISKDTEVSTIKIGEVDIEVKHYVPMQDKLLAIDSILQDAFEYNMVNKAKADALLSMYIMMLYTNISFGKKERENLFETYDLLEKNGVIDTVVGAIPEIEYNAFVDYCNMVMEDYNKYKNSIVGVAEQVLNSLPEKLEGINDMIKNFDPSQFNVITDVINNLGGSDTAITNEILGQN